MAVIPLFSLDNQSPLPIVTSASHQPVLKVCYVYSAFIEAFI
jgi:hypothetical protein